MSNEDIITPQFALPFEFLSDGDVRLTEQGSDEEVQNNVWTILSYEPGQLIASPDFGTLQTVFSKDGTNLDSLQQIITKWEPNANEIIESDPNWFKNAIETITVRRDLSA